MQRIIDFVLPENPINPFPGINWYDFAKEMLDSYNPDSHECQRCHKRIWSSGNVTYYDRAFVWPYNGRPRKETIYIPVYLCEECGRSEDGTGTVNGDYYHAILGGIIIPFTRYTLPFILTVLDCYVNRTGTVEDVCAQWKINRKTLYSWRDRYMEQYNFWADTFHSTESFSNTVNEKYPDARDVSDRVMAIALGLVNCITQAVVAEFFKKCEYSFMQPSDRTHLRNLPKGRRL